MQLISSRGVKISLGARTSGFSAAACGKTVVVLGWLCLGLSYLGNKRRPGILVHLLGRDPWGAFFTYTKAGPRVAPLVVLAPSNGLTLF